MSIHVKKNGDETVIEITNDPMNKTRYTKAQLEKRISGLSEGITKFNSMLEYYQGLLDEIESYEQPS